MRQQKRFWVTAACILVVLILVLILAILSQFFFIVNFKLYRKNELSMDLREKEISAQEYEKIQRNVPRCFILWNAPFQGKLYSSDTKELTVTSLTEQDVAQMDYFPLLEVVHAEDCVDYDQLLALQKRRPEVELSYDVKLGGEAYSRTASEITVSGIQQEEIPYLDCLTQLEKVVVSGKDGADNIDLLQTYCKERGVSFLVEMGDRQVETTAQTLTLSGVTDEDLSLLTIFPDLRELHLVEPVSSAENLLQLQQSRPECAVTWEKQIWGKTVSNADGALADLPELDLSECEAGSLSQVEEGMAYFPEIKQVFLGECGIDNEEIAAYRERVRPNYKVVWTVICGTGKNGSFPVRTDETSFMPLKHGIYYFFDEDVYNVRYCEDMIAIDLGHMAIKDVSFVENMPHLKYLVLALTSVEDITPLSTCKELVFLEIDWSWVKDYSPLLGCTALEDLNLGRTWGDPEPIGKMTWLKNLWWVSRSNSVKSQLAKTLTETNMMFKPNERNTTGFGWRRLPNYYAMRDALGMYYMD